MNSQLVYDSYYSLRNFPAVIYDCLFLCLRQVFVNTRLVTYNSNDFKNKAVADHLSKCMQKLIIYSHNHTQHCVAENLCKKETCCFT